MFWTRKVESDYWIWENVLKNFIKDVFSLNDFVLKIKIRGNKLYIYRVKIFFFLKKISLLFICSNIRERERQRFIEFWVEISGKKKCNRKLQNSIWICCALITNIYIWNTTNSSEITSLISTTIKYEITKIDFESFVRAKVYHNSRICKFIYIITHAVKILRNIRSTYTKIVNKVKNFFSTTGQQRKFSKINKFYNW